jgi:hypothetical protein
MQLYHGASQLFFSQHRAVFAMEMSMFLPNMLYYDIILP